MASETPSPTGARSGTPTLSATWLRGLAAGLVGGLGLAVFLSLTAPAVVDSTVPATVGLSGSVAGWALLMAFSGVLGIAFTGAVERRTVQRPLSTTVVLGIGYSIVLWLAVGVAVPVVTGIVGANGPTVPWLAPTVLAGLLIYGIVVGIGHWLLG